MTTRPLHLANRQTPALLFAALLIVLSAIAAAAAPETGREPPGTSIEIPGLGRFDIGTPCVHANLAIYPLVSTDPVTVEAEFVTLGEALNRKLVKVHETRNVNKLAISNRSDKHVFRQVTSCVVASRIGWRRSTSCCRPGPVRCPSTRSVWSGDAGPGEGARRGASSPHPTIGRARPN